MQPRAREMRNVSTKGEIKFWCELVQNKKCGYQFYRQKPLYHYIVDFYSAKLKLVVEIDGTSHDDKQEYDVERDKVLVGLGLKVLYYKDEDVYWNFHLVEKDFKEQLLLREKEIGIIK